MILILPCGGESSRFPGTRPKWLLNQPEGNLMVFDSIKLLDLKNVDKIVLIASKNSILDNEKSLRKAFDQTGIKKNFELFALETKTSSQPETVYRYLRTIDEDTSFFIKDCDGQFDCLLEAKNEVITADVGLLTGTAAVSKSYCKINEFGNVTAVVEKQVVSQNFCVGGYSFESSKKFIETYEAIQHHENLYVSHVIDHMILNTGSCFSNKKCNLYEDWGTLEDWLKYKDTFRTLFVDIDGCILKNASEYFTPVWGESDPILENVNYLKSLKSSGRVQLILTTARKEEFRKTTEDQIKNLGLEYDAIIFGLLHSKRVLINDHSKTNPFPSCLSFSIERDVGQLQNLGIMK